jgi:hypothetical protein
MDTSQSLHSMRSDFDRLGSSLVIERRDIDEGLLRMERAIGLLAQ